MNVRSIPLLFPLVLAACSAETNLGEVTAETDSIATSRPNIVFILADDLSWNLVQYMPHLRAMQATGMTFSRYYVSDSLCCPSRTSILTGKFPHDSGVFSNGGDDGGYETFLSRGNEQHTVAVALNRAEYHTAFMGKYLNGYEPDPGSEGQGWDEWVGAGKAYSEYDYDLDVNGMIEHHEHDPNDYLTDVLSRKAQRFIADAATKRSPFMIEIATFAPHSPYTPAKRNEDDFPGLGVPRTPAFGARPHADDPAWLRAIPPLTDEEITKLDEGFRKRAQAVQAIDDMIGAIQEALIEAGVDRNTYLVFSSDNGFHMGDHSLRSGKMTAFDTDIRVPLVITGPRVEAGSTVHAITQNIDLCPTFEELGHAAIPARVDGHSLVPLLHDEAINWRAIALIEHHGPDFMADDPDLPARDSGNPTTYESIRIPGAVYVEYATNEKEYHELSSDPYELDNTFRSLSAERKKSLHDALVAVKNCHDGQSCWDAQHLEP